VSKPQLVGLAPKSQADQLMYETNPENGHLAHHAANALLRVGYRLGIARTVRQEDTIGLERQHVFGAGGSRNHCDAAALADQPAQNIVLDSVVVGDHVQFRRQARDHRPHLGVEIGGVAHAQVPPTQVPVLPFIPPPVPGVAVAVRTSALATRPVTTPVGDRPTSVWNQRTLARLFRGHPFIVVPEVVTSLSRERVLVSRVVVIRAHLALIAPWWATVEASRGEQGASAAFRRWHGQLVAILVAGRTLEVVGVRRNSHAAEAQRLYEPDRGDVGRDAGRFEPMQTQRAERERNERTDRGGTYDPTMPAQPTSAAPPERPEPESLALATEFPAPTRDEWRALVSAVLAKYYDAARDAAYFGIIGAVTLVAGVVVFALTPWISRELEGVH